MRIEGESDSQARSISAGKTVFNLIKTQQEKKYDAFMKYNWKDLLVDAAIVAVVLGVLALIIGSFPVTFSKFLPFLK